MRPKLLFSYFLASVFIFLISFAGNWLKDKDSKIRQVPEFLPGGDDDKPVEEVYKNIQVLKGMPKKDLHMVMHFFRASLGVNCAFCHVHDEKTDKWIWESDDKEEKGTARNMINMVKGINKDYFEGFSAISCYSCHKGGTQVPRIPLLPQTPSTMKEESRDTTLPPAEVIIDSYYKSLGNTDKIKKAASRYSKGTVTGFNGKSFDIEVYQQAPNKYLQSVTTPQGTSLKGFDGTAGWQKNQQGVSDVDDYQLAQLMDFTSLIGDFDLTGRYSKVQLLGKDTLLGKTAYVVRAIIDENRNDRLYFDVETGLLLRKKEFVKTMIGYVPKQTDYLDYRSVEGLMMPFTIHYSYLDPWMEAERKYSEIKLNVPVDNVNFQKP